VREGFLDLRTHFDLFKKLEWEFKGLSENPKNSYIAYNFFVTAWHLLEWQFPDPDGKPLRKSRREQSSILQICEHLAVGAKHFAPSGTKHQSFAGSKRRAPSGGSWGGAWGESWGGAWGRDPGGQLTVILDGEAAARYGPSIGILELAEQVMHYWRSHFAVQSIGDSSA
jgi:hypothetical protein